MLLLLDDNLEVLDADLGVSIKRSILFEGALTQIVHEAAPAERWCRRRRTYSTKQGQNVTYEDRTLDERNLTEMPTVSRFVEDVRSARFAAYLSRHVGSSLRQVGRVELHALQHGDMVEWHTDNDGARRLAIIVYLSAWTAEWGGLLMVRAPGRERLDLVPMMNSMVVLDVTRATEHSVSYVRRPAADRLTLTAWFETARPHVQTLKRS